MEGKLAAAAAEAATSVVFRRNWRRENADELLRD
jgi:hypothetical protein